ncbi:hypothetical protein LNI90_03950 [Tenacibaculum dicentrarchi]|uniref:Uncharacterized protein n=1 Tax=Tenacibaculum dicentrarchi TaxID=669041 RepID=A0ABM9P2Q0_9FLAO|nr:hypothetical protein [Tenacibaculum finnmarkense]MCD8404128.1 hypothetical protein [Tenacibaculum dicentrarchi]MCD8407081.1 hypothetical protein [Tenacibaculum dicentrarchi]MCD8413942.1 hypothetical protein [Tenacibaculum dicentrarchi]MCD8419420.1 hypothetical protein [Tenacibaculum dicentrarchi]MCD8424436.1 hypothetical protein [Tenacibaculum dicentrarchi]
MRDNSNTFIYIIASIIILHFLVGFGFLIYKMTKKTDDKKEFKNGRKE